MAIVESQRRRSLQVNNEMFFEGHTKAVQHLVVKGDYLYSSSGDETLRRFVLEVHL